MPLTEDAVREQLKNVIDPELFVNIVDLGLVYVINLVDREDGTKDVQIEMTMTSPMCPAGPQLVSGCKMALQHLDEVNDIDVKVVLDPPWSPERMTEEARDELGIF
ncbi:MAG: metal-sulfur cluster assembly factor [Planctomycetes bacterium]|nr:metal-sulfur cluster assembly factor [Planctomycetota bacterium]MBL7040032.1 metal-sulfur cluster assembly factor [Pirellulaceae bacterium]